MNSHNANSFHVKSLVTLWCTYSHVLHDQPPSQAFRPVFDLQVIKWEGLGTCSTPNRKCASVNKGQGIGLGRDFNSGCFRNIVHGGGNRSWCTYFSNLVDRMRLYFMIAFLFTLQVNYLQLGGAQTQVITFSCLPVLFYSWCYSSEDAPNIFLGPKVGTLAA